VQLLIDAGAIGECADITVVIRLNSLRISSRNDQYVDSRLWYGHYAALGLVASRWTDEVGFRTRPSRRDQQLWMRRGLKRGVGRRGGS